jgi:hypothetical protein
MRVQACRLRLALRGERGLKQGKSLFCLPKRDTKSKFPPQTGKPGELHPLTIKTVQFTPYPCYKQFSHPVLSFSIKHKSGKCLMRLLNQEKYL